jgi:hypothetical protein
MKSGRVPLLILLTLGALVLPFTGEAQQGVKIPRIGLSDDLHAAADRDVYCRRASYQDDVRALLNGLLLEVVAVVVLHDREEFTARTAVRSVCRSPKPHPTRSSVPEIRPQIRAAESRWR